jgi:hypothetical protein
MLAGGDCIHDVDVAWLRRHRQRAGPPGHGAVHVGTFLRGFTLDHTRQLDHLTEQTLARAWQAGAGPATPR